MSKLNLKYFPFPGRGESIRVALTIGGIDFEDEHVGFKEFGEMKQGGKLPFGQLPVLKVGDREYSQSGGLLRYAGKLAGLYPRDDDELAMAIDEVTGVMEDVISNAFKYTGKDPDMKKQAREEFATVDVPRLVGNLEKVVSRKSSSSTPWLCGDKISTADVMVYVLIRNFKIGFYEHVPTTVADSYTTLMASYDAVAALPRVIEYVSKQSK